MDFSTLCSPQDTEGQYLLKFQNNEGNTAVFMVPNVRRQNIRNIEQWTTVFNTFVAIYTQTYPNEAPSLMKYGSVVRELAFQSANWKFYDDNFRQLRQTECLPWDQIHSELYLRAHLNKSKVGSGPRVPSKTNGPPFPKGFC